jgi:glycolate oxidase FAD binding subunit
MTATWSFDELQRAVPGAHLLTGGDVERYAVDGLRPAAVMQPADAEDVAAVLRFASGRGLTVTPRGGGTAIDVGNRPARLDLVLDLTRLNRIVEHRPQDLTVTVEAGVTLAELQAALAARGQMLALDPPLSSRATVGGVLAANGFGPRRQRYGTARDLLIGSRALLADGTPVRAGGKVVKNVAGYDLNKLWIGSCGTLAVITEATFKVVPAPAGFGMLLAAFPTAEQAQTVAVAVARSRLQPLTLDLIGPAAARPLAAAGGVEPPPDAWLLLAETGGAPAVVERTVRDLTLMAKNGGSSQVTGVEEPQRERLMQRLRDYGRSVDDPADWIIRLSVLPSETMAAIEAIHAEAGGPTAAIIVRAGSGIVYCCRAADESTRGDTMVARLRERIGRIGGSVVVERVPAAAKASLDVWGIAGPDAVLMRRVKDAYDPAGVLSPGRLI